MERMRGPCMHKGDQGKRMQDVYMHRIAVRPWKEDVVCMHICVCKYREAMERGHGCVQVKGDTVGASEERLAREA